MGHKTNIDSAERSIYFAANGDDNFSGRSREVPKKTIQAAINAAAALGPTPRTPTSVIGVQGGIFAESFLMADFVQLNAPGIFFETDQAITVECSSLSGITGTVAINELDNGAVFEIDTRDSFGIDMAYTSVTGNNAVIFDIKGACESIFIDVNSNQISGTGSICYRFTGTASSILFFAASQIDLLGNNCAAVVWDSSSTGAGTIEAITTNGVDARSGTFATGSGSTGFEIKQGIYNANIASCKAATIIRVDAGATLNIEMTDGDGDIVVDGTLNCDIIKHSGSITNNGTINGNINGVPFGSYRQKHKEESVLNASSFVDQIVSGTDNFMQVEFGSAQFGPSDPVQLSSAGTVTINLSDQYNLSVVLQYGRDGAAGGFALVFFRVLIDGAQVGNSVSAKLDNPNQAFPVQFELALDLIAAQVLTLEFWRDSSGFDAGSLFAQDPVIAGAKSSASAAIIITRNRNVQPVEIPRFPFIEDLIGLYDQLGIVGSTPVTAWRNSVVGQPDLDVVAGTAANLTRITALGHDVVNASGGVSLETLAGSLISSPATVFVIAKFNNAAPPANQILIDARSSLTDRMMFQSRNFSSDRFTIFQGSTLVTFALADPYDTDPHIWTGEFKGDSTTKLTVEDVGEVTGDAGSGDWDFGTFFASTTGFETADGYIALVAIIDRAMSTEEKTAVINFLKAEFGL